ncbi:MAG: hypothetical protein JJE09_11730 [Bacteroidia bacterium]|nr:hypothetical protein [Bacteroidia bacterium]
MITIEDFKCSPFEKKCDIVTTSTNYLAMRMLGDCKVYLYHTENFFIEVYYSSVHKKVLMINAFKNTDELMAYAESVSLTDLGL